MHYQRLVDLSRAVGPEFGTEHFSMFLHSLTRMQRFENIVELGTGLGVSAFWMAQAVKENGVGHVWSVDCDAY